MCYLHTLIVKHSCTFRELLKFLQFILFVLWCCIWTCKQNDDAKWHQDLTWIICSPACTFNATSFWAKHKFCRIFFPFEKEENPNILGLFCSISHTNVNRVQMENSWDSVILSTASSSASATIPSFTKPQKNKTWLEFYHFYLQILSTSWTIQSPKKSAIKAPKNHYLDAYLSQV